MENKHTIEVMTGTSMGRTISENGSEINFNNIDYNAPKQSQFIFGDFSDIVLCDLERTPEERKESIEKFLKHWEIEKEKDLIKENNKNLRKKQKELKKLFKKHLKIEDIKEVIKINVFDIKCYKDYVIEFTLLNEKISMECQDYNIFTDDREYYDKLNYKRNLLNAKIERYEYLHLKGDK